MARDYFVDGLSMSEIANRHEITYYEVRKTMKKIQRLTYVSNKAAPAVLLVPLLRAKQVEELRKTKRGDEAKED